MRVIHPLPSSTFIRQVRQAVQHEYLHGAYPEFLPMDVCEYMTPDGGLLKALRDLEWALIELEKLRREGRRL